MDISFLPADIILKICNYHVQIQILLMRENGWKDINDEVLLYSNNKEKWHRNVSLYKTIRWRLAGFIVCNNPIMTGKLLQIDKSRIRPCSCGRINEPLPYTCKLKSCKCGEKKHLSVEDFTCFGCGKNPRKPWTMPL